MCWYWLGFSQYEDVAGDDLVWAVVGILGLNFVAGGFDELFEAGEVVEAFFSAEGGDAGDDWAVGELAGGAEPV